MILDKLDPGVTASYSPEFQKAFEAIAGLTPESPLGRLEIDGDRIYGNVMENDAVLPSAEKLEAHREYVDIQAVICGVEDMAWANIDGLEVVDPYDPEKDVEFRRTPSAGVSRLELTPGLFAVFYPEDGHYGKIRPVSVPAGKVKKVVIKIKL